MRTNIDLNDTLVRKAMRITKLKTKKEVVNRALEEFIKMNTRKEILRFFDSNCWEGDLEEMRAARFPAEWD